jgi:hypothetical protein
MPDKPSKQTLRKLINDIKTKRFRESEAKGMMSSMGEELKANLGPVLQSLTTEQSQAVTKAIQEAVKGLKVDSPAINVPNVEVPPLDTSRLEEVIYGALSSFRFPTPRVEFDASKIKVPEVKMPDQVDIKGWIGLMGYDKGLLSNPIPVQIRDKDGKPVDLSGIGKAAFGGSGGGKADHFTVKGITSTVGVVTVNPDGNPVYSGGAAGGGLTDAELRASAVPVSQASGANWSVSVSDIFGTAAANLTNPDGRLKVELPTGSSGLTDNELRAAHLDVQQVSGSIDSVKVTGFDTSVAASLLNGDGTSLDPRDRNWTISEVLSVLQASGAVDSVVVNAFLTSLETKQVSGFADSVFVTGGSGTIFAVPANVAGLEYDGDNPQPVTAPNHFDVQQVSGSADSVVVNNVLVSLEVKQVSGFADSVFVVGSSGTTAVVGTIPSDAADDGSPPLKNGGIARTGNPTAVSNGDMVAWSADDLGRQVVRPVQVRDLIKTAYASVSNGTETTLLAGVAGSFLDLVMIVGSNNSDVAVSVDIRAVTAGNIVNTLRIPANGTAGWTPTVPWPQDATGNNWTVDGPDETGRTLTFSALFSQEV